MTVALPGPGDVLGHFRLIEKIGEGGMGVVFRARDERLDRDVAVKVLNERMLSDNSSRARFRQEALTLGRLNHPNVETVYDFHSESGLDYLVIEYVSGQSLDARLREGPLPQAEVADLGLQLAKGLAAAHAQGVVHGDLKPSNLRVTPESVLKILDFGLAKMMASPDAKTVSTTDSDPITGYGGTPPYMSPEQVNGAEPNALSDVYAAGVVLYEMATGQRPFPQHGSLLREAILYVAPAGVREKNREISAALESVILKCLEKDAHKRYQSAHELAVELENATAGFSWETAYWRCVFGLKRHRWLAATLAFVLLAAGGWAVRQYLAGQKPSARMSVVVAEFQNRTGEAVFDQTPRELISTALGQSRQVFVLPTGRIRDALKRMEAPATTEMDEKVAEEICTRDGLRSVVTGSVSKLGSRYVVTARVLSCNGDLILSTDRQFDGPERLPPAMDAIAATIRRRWGESEAAIEKASQPLATVTSSSLEAVRLYSKGKQELYQGNFAAAITLFTKAVELDPDFAMAHEYLATAYVHQSDSDRASEEYAKAAQLSSRVSEKEREKILGDQALFQNDNATAISHYQVLTVLSPEDPAPHVNMAESYRNMQRYDQSVTEVKKALELMESPSVRNNLATYYYALGKQEDAWREIQAALKESPDDIKGLHVLTSYYLGTGQEEKARAVAERMLTMGGSAASLARADLADAAWTREEMKEAANELESGIIADAQVSNLYEKTRKQILMAELHVEMRQPSKTLEVLGRIKQPTDPILMFLMGRAYARAGRVSAAQQQLRQLQDLPNQTPSTQSQENILLAEIALAQKQGEEAVRSAALAQEHLKTPLAVEALARADEQAGNTEDAIRQYEMLLARANEMQYDSVDWPALHNVAKARYRLGVLYQEMRKPELAQAQFEALMKYAGDGLATGPMYSDTKARLAQVTPRATKAADQHPQHTAPSH